MVTDASHTPSSTLDSFIQSNRADKSWLAAQAGFGKLKLYAYLEPRKYPRHRLGDADFGALAALINVKTGARFSAQDVKSDYLERGGVLQVERGSAA